MLSGMTNANIPTQGTGEQAGAASGLGFWRLQNLIVLLITNEKGGVGKTTVTANLGAMLALIGYRVLLIDAEQQGNLTTDDFGLAEDDPRNDLGQHLAIVTTYGGDLRPVTVRERVDLVPGGRHIANLSSKLVDPTGRAEAVSNLREAIAKHSDAYDIVIIDSPPGDKSLADTLMRLASHLLIPAGEDLSSEKGIRTLGGRYATAKSEGAEIELLGVLMFGVDPRATARNPLIRSKFESIVDKGDLFEAVVPFAKAAAIDLREHHMTAAELVDKDGKTRSTINEDGTARRLFTRNGLPLAQAYQDVAVETLSRIKGSYERQDAAAEAARSAGTASVAANSNAR